MAALVHAPNGTEQLNRYPAGDPHTSVCEQFNSGNGDTIILPTNPTDLTCTVCFSIVRGMAASPGAL